MGSVRYRIRRLLTPRPAPPHGAARAWDRLIPGTHVRVAELIEMMRRDHSCERLFLWYPDLDPDSVRDALDQASRGPGEP